MDPITQQTVIAAAGAGGGDPLYVDDVFSTFLYEGNGGTQSINNGIDLAGEGGLVWMKRRGGTDSHILMDTLRPNKKLSSNLSAAEVNTTTTITSFNANGFSLGNPSQSGVNDSGEDIVSWTFRKAPGFFDVVTYTGNGSVQNISHNLGSIPGMIIVKNLTTATNWETYHRSTGATKKLELNGTAAASTNSGTWNNTEPTSSVFTVGTNNSANGATYVAYIFAHDEPVFGTDKDESIIKCGSYTGSGSTQNISLGFEPQWVMFKATSTSGDWKMGDIMRGMTDASSQVFDANGPGAEGAAAYNFAPYSDGFTIGTNLSSINQSGQTYIYMAIRRPNKPPEAGTEVFKATNLVAGTVSLGFVPDLNLSKYTAGVQSWYWLDRLRGGSANLYSDSTAAEGAGVAMNFDETTNSISIYGSLYANWAFKRAPGFFDMVAYSGTGAVQNVNHNLEAVPELMIIKLRNEVNNWAVYYGDNTDYMRLNSTAGGVDASSWWNDTSPTSTEFTVGTDPEVNKSGYNLIAYLFATLPGISKVGSYTGTGNDINVDCGFSAGARFALIKRTDSTGDWYVWDSVRGIVSGNDPYLFLNSTAAEVTSTDYIDPLNSGFTVTSAAPAALNASGGSYIFLAIA